MIDKLLDLSTTQSIVVFANYRTGSTALCDMLAQKFHLENYDEAFHRIMQKKVTVSRPFIVKIMPDQTIPEYFQDLLHDVYKIGLSRKSIRNQIASLYLCDISNVWHYKKKQSKTPWIVKVDQLKIEDNVRYIFEMKHLYDQCLIKKDLEFFYEDIEKVFAQSQYQVYSKPENYDQLLNVVDEKIHQLFGGSYCDNF